MAALQKLCFIRTQITFLQRNLQTRPQIKPGTPAAVNLLWKCSSFQHQIRKTGSFHVLPKESSGMLTDTRKGVRLSSHTNTPVTHTIITRMSCLRFKSTFTKPAATLNSSTEKRDASTTESGVEFKENVSGHIKRHQESQQTFDNYKMAYGNKSSLELLRVLVFFFLCKFSFFTNNALKILDLSYKVLGRRPAEFIIRKTVYNQFVAGETGQDVKMVAGRLRHGGVASILCVPMETDDQVSNCQSMEPFFDANLEKVVASLQLAVELGDVFPMTQFRVSALMSGDLTKTISRFCGPTTHNPDVFAALLGAMLGRQVDFRQLPGWEAFPQEKNAEFMKGLRRLGKVKDALETRDVIVLIDAEYTYINPALRLLSLCLMKACNTKNTKIFYTYQAYLKATRTTLQQDLMYASANGFGFGVKLVRGAYLVKERQLARDQGYDDPVNETFDLTSTSYYSCLDLLMEQVARTQPPPTRFMVASHNEDTVRHAIRRMDILGIPKDGPSVFFGQLYGMADHVSFTLGNHGYRVYKSIPYGPVMETLPYLARRAQENQAILLNARKERKLVAKALKDRILFKV